MSSKKYGGKFACRKIVHWTKKHKQFPKIPNVMEKCIEATGRENWLPTKSSTTCSTHLSENDFTIKKSGNRYSKPEAIPSNQDAVEDFDDSCDPNQSKDSSSQTIVIIRRKIEENISLQKSQDDGISNINSHVEIKQEDLEDIDAAVPNLSFASNSQTDPACGSPTIKSHIETYTVYEPQNTLNLPDIKEDPGSPMSDVSIHSEAAQSPEEPAIKIKLNKKIEMLNKNKEILKRLHEEIIILEKKQKTLIADIKYINKKTTE